MRLKDYSEEIRKEHKRIQRKCIQWDKIKKEEIIAEIKKNNSDLKCFWCNKRLEIDNINGWQVHAKLHVLDKERYLQKGNCSPVCKSCHPNLKEKYELADGTVIDY